MNREMDLNAKITFNKNLTMSPYKITSATLTTYSGRKVEIKLESEIFSKPLRVVKEQILDSFIKMCKESTDPFVKIECKTKPLFNI